jgi:WXG100 family type VII secretion target
MGDLVTANFSSLGEGASSFVASYNGLTSTVETLQSQLQSNLNNWAGTAQTAYHEAQTVWNTAIADMGRIIQGMSGVISDANANYQEGERVNSAMFGG